MPGPSLVESRLWESVTAPPADGDDVAIASGTAPLRANVLQKLYARESYLFNGPFHGFVDPAYQADITASGTDRTWTLRTAKRISITRADGSGVIDVFAVGGTPLAVSIGVLGANDEAFVYAYNNAGVLALEVSSTLPEPSLDFKDSDTTRVYLGSFRTDSAGRAITQVQRGRDVMIVGDGLAAYGDLRCGETLADGVTAVPALAPSVARVGIYRLYSTTNATPLSATRWAYISPRAGLATVQQFWKTTSTDAVQHSQCEVAIVGGQIDIATTKLAEIVAEAHLLGWRE